ncbi:glycosyl hydrolase family 43 protein [Xylariales sp. AK1849]|nr:glycosyl hydrolase family 43 protein [Xylariales sp. AK1849]
MLPTRSSLFLCVVASFLASWATASPSTSSSHRRQAEDATFTNPVVWEDLPDLDVFRVGNVFYYSSSTFAYSPGAPVYKSYDLVSWTPVSHSVPTLDFGSSKYNLTNETDRAYVEGIWASTLRYRESTDTFYWIGCIQSSRTYIYTSSGSGAGSNGGEAASWDWTQAAVLDSCYYDCGLLIDEDDTMYVAYGKSDISVAQLSSDGLSEVQSQVVYSSGSTYIEGSHMYKINGYYWIIPTKPATGEWALRSTSPWGPYEQTVLFDYLVGPLPNAGYSHQGGIVDTPEGDWYYVAFMDSFPSGRIPVLAPLTWNSAGWPEVVLNSSGDWGTTYPKPVSTNSTVPPLTGTDDFTGTSLSEEWEWNHNPDTAKWSLAGSSEGGLVLQTATVTDDLFTARNTLTHRIIGPESEATFQFDISEMADGDRAGAVLFRDWSAYIGVHKTGDTATLVYVDDLNLNSDWTTNSTGTVAASGPDVTESIIYLRITADITPAFGLDPVRPATFSYSTDGSTFTQLGDNFLLNNDWTYFTGYRYAAFNFATLALGGQVTLKSFEMELVT